MTESIDWAWWLDRWDKQQSGYLADRERRYTVMFDVLEALLPEKFTAVDLACGPGSLSKRLLDQFPDANCLAVDLDPVLLTLGKGALGDLGGRLRWVETDINDANWIYSLEIEQVDAVLSTTALHWLPVDRLVSLYHQLGELIRPGGVFLNGDHMSFSPDMPQFTKVVDEVKEKRRSSAFGEQSIESWGEWWDALKEEPGLQSLFEEREHRFSWREKTWANTGYDLQAAALKEADFIEVGTIWQNMDNRVLMAVR